MVTPSPSPSWRAFDHNPLSSYTMIIISLSVEFGNGALLNVYLTIKLSIILSSFLNIRCFRFIK
jgi:hypothetical protein